MIKIGVLIFMLFTLSCCRTNEGVINAVNGSYSVLYHEDCLLRDSSYIMGNLIDKSENCPIAGGVIYVNSPKMGTFSDSLGRYILKIRSGSYKICALCVGYATLCTKEISIKPNKIVNIDFQLGTTIVK